MLTGMSERDWDLALEVFRAARSRRGAKGRDDRKFLEAVYFTVHNVTWRALLAAFGKWNSVWKRFSRLSQAGTFEAFFQMLAEHSPTAPPRADVRLYRGARPCLSRGCKGGQTGQALGRSKGGFSTKIHLKADFEGQPLVFELTGGEASDSPQFPTLLDAGPDMRPRAVMADKGYDAKSNRQAARARGVCPVIPYRFNIKAKPAFFPNTLYKGRARIEHTMGKLKRFKRIALRCEKTAQN